MHSKTIGKIKSILGSGLAWINYTQLASNDRVRRLLDSYSSKFFACGNDKCNLR